MTKITKKEVCEDAISRKEAVFELNEAQIEYDENYKGLGEAKIIIDKLPSVQPKRNKGHWIAIDEESHTAVCSCCNRNNLFYGDYCKWCGALVLDTEKDVNY